MVTGQEDTGQGLHLSNGHNVSPSPDLLNGGNVQGRLLGIPEEQGLDHTPHAVTNVRGHGRKNVDDRVPDLDHNIGRDQQEGPDELDQGLWSY